MAEKKIKVTLIGDENTGKSNLIQSYCMLQQSFIGMPSEPDTILDCYSVKLTMTAKAQTPMNVEYCDASGSSKFDRLRKGMTYPTTDLFLLCFSTTSRSSFQSITSKWMPEIASYASTPVILIGTKVDLRSNGNIINNENNEVSKEEGEQLAMSINALQYIECSAITQIGVKTVFDSALEGVIYTRKDLKKKGILSKLILHKKRKVRFSYPADSHHETHLGWDVERGFNVFGVPIDWTQMLGVPSLTNHSNNGAGNAHPLVKNNNNNNNNNEFSICDENVPAGITN